MLPEPDHSLKPVDLRGILKYVPLWRGHTFVMSMDSALQADENLATLLRDIAVLRNLNIQVVLVYGIGQVMGDLADQRSLSLSDTRGEGPTDEQTLQLASEASALVGQRLMQGLTQNELRCTLANAVRATERGILKGIDQLHSGKVEKIDREFLQSLLAADTIPLIPPVAISRDGLMLRLNADLIAAEVATTLQASKLIYLCAEEGLRLNGKFQLNLPVETLRCVLEQQPEHIPALLEAKARYAIKTIDQGTPRVHLIDARMPDHLLTEIFSKVGVGTMIYANDYERIRSARKRDIYSIASILKHGARDESLRKRSRAEIEKALPHTYVYEIDGSLIGCVSLHLYQDAEIAEIEGLAVQSFYQGRGVGQKLVEYALMKAREIGFKEVFALSTQSAPFFEDACGFTDAEPEALPAQRREQLEAGGRHSRVLRKTLN